MCFKSDEEILDVLIESGADDLEFSDIEMPQSPPHRETLDDANSMDSQDEANLIRDR